LKPKEIWGKTMLHLAACARIGVVVGKRGLGRIGEEIVGKVRTLNLKLDRLRSAKNNKIGGGAPLLQG
jgi:hypothetical protein